MRVSCICDHLPSLTFSFAILSLNLAFSEVNCSASAPVFPCMLEIVSAVLNLGENYIYFLISDKSILTEPSPCVGAIYDFLLDVLKIHLEF